MKKTILFAAAVLMIACTKTTDCVSPTQDELNAVITNQTRPQHLADYIAQSECVVSVNIDYCGACGADVPMVGNAEQGVINVVSMDGSLNRVYFANLLPLLILKTE